MSSFKLYYSPTSCGAASFLTATIGNVAFDAETVDLGSHKTQSGKDFYAINPKGNLPTIAFNDGSILNENVAALTFLGDQGNAGLTPNEGTPERYQYLNHVAFINSEIHPAFGPFFNPALTPDARASAEKNLQGRLGKLDTMLGGKSYLNGASLSAADVYAHVVLSWAAFTGSTLPAGIQTYNDGLKAHPELQKAHAALAAHSQSSRPPEQERVGR